MAAIASEDEVDSRYFLDVVGREKFKKDED